MRQFFLKQNTKLVSFLMLGVYAWMSTVLQFAHTDDILLVATGPVANSAPIGHLTQAPAPEGPCLACEWIAAAHSASPISGHVEFEPQTISAYSRQLPQNIHILAPVQKYLRGPPQLLG